MISEVIDVATREKETAYIVGDASEVLPDIPSLSVTAWVTSPPYYKLKEYGGRDGVVDEGTYEEYLSRLHHVWVEAFRASRTNSCLWVVVDIFRSRGAVKLLPFEMAQGAEEAGWTLRDVFIWNKGKALPWSRPGGFRNGYEHVLYLTKGSRFRFRIDRVRDPVDVKAWWVKYPERYNPRGKVPEGVWDFQIPTKGSWGESELKHPCPFPLGLVERILSLSTDKGDLVVDPFAGSGSVVALAAAMGRRGIAVELHGEYREDFDLLSRQAETFVNRTNLHGRQQRAFERRIWKLRKLKFCKELIRLVRNAPGNPVVTLGEIVSRGAGTSSGRHSIGIRLLSETKSSSEQILGIAEALVDLPPLSKYQLDVTLEVHSSPWPWAERSLWVYGNGRFWKYFDKASGWEDIWRLSSMGKKRKGKFPLIVSDIRADIDSTQ